MANDFEWKNAYLKGEEIQLYLNNIDSLLAGLITNLKFQSNHTRRKKLEKYAKDNNWDWSRLPSEENTNHAFAILIQRIREEYSWFGHHMNPKDPLKNRQFYSQLMIDNNTGLPDAIEFRKLSTLQKDYKKRLDGLLSSEDLARNVLLATLSDKEKLEKVESKVNEFHKIQLQRNFFNQLSKADLLYDKDDYVNFIYDVKKVEDFGVEALWNIYGMSFQKITGTFQLYVIDAWQDNRVGLDKAIIESESGDVNLSNVLLKKLEDFAAGNTPKFMIGFLDNYFESFHPVHISTMHLGPVDNIYHHDPDNYGFKPYEFSEQILREDPEFRLLRSDINYSYAPNHTSVENVMRQTLAENSWKEVIVTVPSHYASIVSDAFIGDNVKIFECEEHE